MCGSNGQEIPVPESTLKNFDVVSAQITVRACLWRML